ncbi:hypothetical protein ALC56_13037 [Trachymyrmex septentrionalis]|uniref:Uncharacterized protein n=1 Tax=Trachymyrmex septentrionalis TaxID=34720 RepID=A0A195EWN0_9HYME|nr:hypothetical protein ALC56_13037 [Trachymyrmex septentrionalis]
MTILAMIQRLVISSCRGKIDIDTYRRIIPSLNILRERTAVIKAEFSIYHMCTVHKKHFYNSTIYLDKINPKENGIGIVDNVSTFQIKKRSPRRNRAIINDDKIPKLNAWTVKALATAEEYNLETLAYGLLDQQLYIPSKISTSTSRKYLYN